MQGLIPQGQNWSVTIFSWKNEKVAIEIRGALDAMLTLVLGLQVLWYKAYLFKGGCVAPKKHNAFTSPSNVLDKIGQAICAMLT